MSVIENWHSKITITIFLLLIYLPLLCISNRQISVTEKRRLSPLPKIAWNKSSIVKFPKKFDLFFSDHFGFREDLTTIHTKISRFLKMTSSKYVYTGKDGWLYLKASERDYRGADPLSQKDLRQWKIALETRYYWLKSKGIPYLFIIAPDKKSIYGEYLQDKNPGRSRLDQLLAYLHGSPVPILDLRPALLKEKSEGTLYLKTDTHWNARGAAIAQYEILKRLEKNFSGIVPRRFQSDDFKLISRPIIGDLETMLYGKSGKAEIVPELQRPLSHLRQTTYSGVKYPKTIASQPDKEAGFVTKGPQGAPRACIFRDSFFDALVPYISRQFSKSLFLWSQPDFKTLENLIASQPFDIVIEERIERQLNFIPKIPTPADQAFKYIPKE